MFTFNPDYGYSAKEVDEYILSLGFKRDFSEHDTIGYENDSVSVRISIDWNSDDDEIDWYMDHLVDPIDYFQLLDILFVTGVTIENKRLSICDFDENFFDITRDTFIKVLKNSSNIEEYTTEVFTRWLDIRKYIIEILKKYNYDYTEYPFNHNESYCSIETIDFAIKLYYWENTLYFNKNWSYFNVNTIEEIEDHIKKVKTIQEIEEFIKST